MQRGQYKPPGEGQEYENQGTPSIFTQRLGMEIQFQSRDWSIGQGIRTDQRERDQSRCQLMKKVNRRRWEDSTGLVNKENSGDQGCVPTRPQPSRAASLWKGVLLPQLQPLWNCTGLRRPAAMRTLTHHQLLHLYFAWESFSHCSSFFYLVTFICLLQLNIL